MLTFAQLDESHVVENFDCGIESLTNYLKNIARQHQTRNLSRVFVVVEDGDSTVLGYYSLANSSVDASAFPKPKKFKLPKTMAIPVVLLGKLAVDKTTQGKGLGSLLLFDALRRCMEVNDRSAAYAIVVDAINDDARKFYLKYEFQILTEGETTRLFLPMQHIVETLK